MKFADIAGKWVSVKDSHYTHTGIGNGPSPLVLDFSDEKNLYIENLINADSNNYQYIISKNNIVLNGHEFPFHINSNGILMIVLNGVNIYLRKLRKSFNVESTQLIHELIARSWSFSSKDSKTTLKFLNKKSTLYGYSKYKKCIVYKEFYSKKHLQEENFRFGDNINKDNNIYDSIWKIHLCRNELFLFRNDITRFRVYIHQVVEFNSNEIIAYNYSLAKVDKITYF